MALTALQPGDLHRPASLEPETVAGRPQRTAWPATKSSSLTNGVWATFLEITSRVLDFVCVLPGGRA
jgi:hypothetical protein